MRASVLSVLGAVFGLNILSIHANVACNNNQPLDISIVPASELAKALQISFQQPVKDLCNTGFSDAGFLTYRSVSTVFTITRTDNVNTFNSCEDHFDDITQQCIAEQGVHGGTVLANRLLYEVYQDTSTYNNFAERALGDEHEIKGIEARTARTARTAKKSRKPKQSKKARKGKNATKVCPLKPKVKGGNPAGKKVGELTSREELDCEDEVDLFFLWTSIPNTKKAMGNSALYFKVDATKSNAWGVTYLHGCTGILITDPTFVIGKQGFLPLVFRDDTADGNPHARRLAHMLKEGNGNCIMLADKTQVTKFITDELQEALDAVDPTRKTEIHFLYTQPKTGSPQLGFFDTAFDDWGYEGAVTKKKYGASSGTGSAPGPSGEAVIQVVGGIGQGKQPEGVLER